MTTIIPQTSSTGGLPNPKPRPSTHPASLAGNLGPLAIIFMVIAAASPLTVIGGAAPLGIALGNGIGYPLTFILIAAILLIFSAGFTAMTRVVEQPGAFYAYITYGLGRHAGAGGAWLAILCYTTIQVAVYCYVGFLVSTVVGDTLPWWACSLLLIGFVGVLGYRRIDLSSKVLGVLLVAEILVMAAIVAAVVLTGGAQGLSLQPFTPSAGLSGAPGIGIMFSAAAYVGFEATAVYRDEARDPDRTIPRATYGALIGITVFYAAGSWAMIMACGPDSVVALAEQDPSVLLQNIAGQYFGTAGHIAVSALMITSMVASVLAFHNVLARYALSMAHARLVPSALGVAHPIHMSPHRGSLTQTVVSAVLVAGIALCGLDPVVEAFTWFSGIGTLAIVLLMCGTSMAALVYFRRHRGGYTRVGAWNAYYAPAAAAMGLAVLAAVLVWNFPVLVSDLDLNGQPAFGALSTTLVLLVVGTVCGGAVHAEIQRQRDPVAFAALARRLTTDNAPS